jgi:hypothetical protein
MPGRCFLVGHFDCGLAVLNHQSPPQIGWPWRVELAIVADMVGRGRAVVVMRIVLSFPRVEIHCLSTKVTIAQGLEEQRPNWTRLVQPIVTLPPRIEVSTAGVKGMGGGRNLTHVQVPLP